jgi:hypothetical protein
MGQAGWRQSDYDIGIPVRALKCEPGSREQVPKPYGMQILLVPRVVAPRRPRLNAPMPVLTRRRDPHRPNCWRIHYSDVHVGTIAKAIGNPGAAESWQWSCGFYPGSRPGEHRNGSAPSFAATRAAFEAAWREYLPSGPRPIFKRGAISRLGPERSIAALIAASGCRGLAPTAWVKYGFDAPIVPPNGYCS